MSPTTARRATTLALATAAGLLGWAGLRMGGADLVTDTTTVGAVDVAVAALVAGAPGWATAALLERYAPRPRTTWVLLSTTVLSTSMLGPTYSAPALTALALMLLHLLVGAVLVGGLSTTLPYRRSAAEPEQDRVVAR